MSRRLIDVSHEIEAGMITYPGLPAPMISDHLSREASESGYAPGTTFQIGRIEMVANTGTYIDAPFHRFEDGADLAGLPLERLADLPGVMIDVTNRQNPAIEVHQIKEPDLRGRAVLIHTGWDVHWRTPQYGETAPYLTRQAAEFLVAAEPALVGIDSVNIDNRLDGTRPAHTLLLKAGIPIAEHLCNLERLPHSGFRFHSVPIKFRGVGTFPVRAYAVIE
ncbi:MAG TPA: cyclase family protein [Blastocatellia bacterium]